MLFTSVVCAEHQGVLQRLGTASSSVAKCYFLYQRVKHVWFAGEAERRQLPTVYVIRRFVSDSDLRSLYQAADAFVLPSRCARLTGLYLCDECRILSSTKRVISAMMWHRLTHGSG